MGLSRSMIKAMRRDPFSIPGVLMRRVNRRLVRRSILDGLLLVPQQSEAQLAKRLAVCAPLAGLGRDTAALERFYELFPERRARLMQQAQTLLAGQVELLGMMIAADDWHNDPLGKGRWDPTAEFDMPALKGRGDLRLVWELSRFHHGLRLAQAFRLTGDERFAQEFARLVLHWHEHNPLGRGINWSCPMEAAIRAINWLAAFNLIEGSAAADRLRGTLAARLIEHARFVLRWIEPPLGNHFLSDLLGLLLIDGSFEGHPEAAKIAGFARSRLQRELRQQIHADGSFAEGSTRYGDLVLEGFSLAALAMGSARPATWEKRLRSAASALIGLSNPSGALPQLGDNDSGCFLPLGEHPTLDARQNAALVAVMYRDPQLAPPMGPWWEKAVWLFGADALELADRAPDPDRDDHLLELPKAGWYTARISGAQLWVCCGPVGLRGLGAHAHNDKLGFELWAGGPLVRDPGTYLYTADRETRDEFRCTAAHATLIVDGLEQTPLPDEPFELSELARPRCLKFERSGNAALFVGEHYGYQQRLGVVHRRTLRFGPGRLEIEDRLQGGGEHGLRISLPLASGLEVELNGDTARIQGDGVRADVRGPADWRVERARYSPGYGRVEPALRLVCQLRRELPCDLSTVISWG
ncbi:MAG: alginate lyase family protein [Candidatus Alcyoniella australis]|nr:alginate lyase family protein [Candidatus Alcyoniella australis]